MSSGDGGRCRRGRCRGGGRRRPVRQGRAPVALAARPGRAARRASAPAAARRCARAARRSSAVPSGSPRRRRACTAWAAVVAGPSVASRTIAERAPDAPARFRAANRPSTGCVRGATRRPRTRSVTQRRPSASSRRPSETRRSAMSSGHSSSASTSSHGHSSVNWLVVSRSWTHGAAGVSSSRAAGGRPDRGQQRLVGAEQAVLGRGRRDQAQRPTERRLPGLRLRHPDGVGAAARGARPGPRRPPRRPG